MTRPEKMSMNEQAMIEELRGDYWLHLKQYAENGFLDLGDGPSWVSAEGQAFAQRRIAQITHNDRWMRKLGMPVAGPRYIRGRQSPDEKTYDWGSKTDD